MSKLVFTEMTKRKHGAWHQLLWTIWMGFSWVQCAVTVLYTNRNLHERNCPALVMCYIKQEKISHVYQRSMVSNTAKAHCTSLMRTLTQWLFRFLCVFIHTYIHIYSNCTYMCTYIQKEKKNCSASGILDNTPRFMFCFILG